MQPGTPVAVAAPVTGAALLTGAPRVVRVAAVTPAAAYLATGDPALPVLCLATGPAARRAARLPCALVFDAPAGDRGGSLSTCPACAPTPGQHVRRPLPTCPACAPAPSVRPGRQEPAATPFAGWRAGQAGTAGGGGLRVGGRRWPVTRWWRPARVRPWPVPTPAPHPQAGPHPQAAELAGRLPDPLDADGRAALDTLLAALRAEAGSSVEPGPSAGRGTSAGARDAAGLRRAVRGLVGRGPGLTPLGDDVLAGLLLAGHAAGSPWTAPLGAAACAAAPRTTVVSAALLAHAARGECVAAVAGLLDALRGGPARDVARAVADVAAIGHTSGAGLVRGVAAGLAAAAPTSAVRGRAA